METKKKMMALCRGKAHDHKSLGTAGPGRAWGLRGRTGRGHLASGRQGWLGEKARAVFPSVLPGPLSGAGEEVDKRQNKRNTGV